MPAGMHHARVGRGARAGRLLLGNGVDVSPEGRRLSGEGPSQKGGDTGLHAQVDQLHAQGGELFPQERSGAVLL